MDSFHTPVFLKEVVDFLDVERGKRYIDATIGGGGHTIEILKRGGIVLGIDCDQEAIDFVKQKFQISSIRQTQNRNFKFQINKDLFLVKGNFRDIDKIARLHGFDEVAGILFDLGASSHQFETPERGFSFGKEGPLDMRMDKDLAVTAEDLLKILTKGEIYEIFRQFGEERFSHTISNHITGSRGVKPITTTSELSELIRRAVGARHQSIHPATKAFQALRIVVNDELNVIKTALPKAVELLSSEGRMAVISFHSLEDSIVKEQFVAFQKQLKGAVLTKKPVRPRIEEINNNRRARSAKLRVFEKT